MSNTKICPTCGETIIFIEGQETKLCPKCGELIYNVKN